MITLPSPLQPYAKAITALVLGVIGWGTQVVDSAPAAITAPEWIGLATVVAASLGVFGVTNAPKPAPEVKP